MGYFPVRYDSRVVIYEREMFIRLTTEYNSVILGSYIISFVLTGPT